MSAYVVSKSHIDLLVGAAMHYGGRDGFQWWTVDENGDYAGWRKLDEFAESYAGTRDTEGYMEYVTPSIAGQILASENVRSVSYRYPNDDVDAGELPGPCDAYYIGPYVYSDRRYVLTPAEVFKAIDCLDYQSCEHPGWTRSEAYSFLRSLRETICRHGSEYDAAPWEWDASDLEARRAARSL